MWNLLFRATAARIERDRREGGIQASAPAEAIPSVLAWISIYRSEALSPLVVLLATVVGALFLHPVLWLVALATLPHLHRYWSWTFFAAQAGDVNAAQVVGVNPTRVACFVDLRLKHRVHRPALRVITVPSGVIDGRTAEVGQATTCVCLYTGDPELQEWNAVAPVPSCAITRSPGELARLSMLVSDDDRRRLELALELAGGDPVSGLHRIGWIPGTPGDEDPDPASVDLLAVHGEVQS